MITFGYGTPYYTICYEWDCLNPAIWTEYKDGVQVALLCDGCKLAREKDLEIEVTCP